MRWTHSHTKFVFRWGGCFARGGGGALLHVTLSLFVHQCPLLLNMHLALLSLLLVLRLTVSLLLISDVFSCIWLWVCERRSRSSANSRSSSYSHSVQNLFPCITVLLMQSIHKMIFTSFLMLHVMLSIRFSSFP